LEIFFIWQAITDFEMARICWSATEEIERGLVEHTGGGRGPLLASDKAGQALFFTYLDAARPGSDAADHALDALGQSIDGLAESQLLPSLYGTRWPAMCRRRAYTGRREPGSGSPRRPMPISSPAPTASRSV